MNWVYTKVISDETKASKICQKMLDYGFISRVDNSTIFEPLNDPIYRFYEDREDLASNCLRP